MLVDYHLNADDRLLAELRQGERWAEAFELLAAPLHEWLYEVQDFSALDERSKVEQLILSFDYVQQQVGQGGFIQLIQNGYVSLLLTVIESLQALGISAEMVRVLDDALKIFVLNKDVLARETSVEEFGRLYAEFREFEQLEERFRALQLPLLRDTVNYVSGKT